MTELGAQFILTRARPCEHDLGMCAVLSSKVQTMQSLLSSKEEYKPWKWRCYRKILHISYKDHVANEEVHAKIQQATRRPDHCKATQTAVAWSCLPFIRSGQNHLGRHSERGKKTRQTEEEVGKQHQGMDRPGVRQVPEGSGEQGKMEKTGCKIICGARTTLAVKGLMMMMMMMKNIQIQPTLFRYF